MGERASESTLAIAVSMNWWIAAFFLYFCWRVCVYVFCCIQRVNQHMKQLSNYWKSQSHQIIPLISFCSYFFKVRISSLLPGVWKLIKSIHFYKNKWFKSRIFLQCFGMSSAVIVQICTLCHRKVGVFDNMALFGILLLHNIHTYIERKKQTNMKNCENQWLLTIWGFCEWMNFFLIFLFRETTTNGE